MLLTLIKKEILNNLLNLRFAVVYFLCIFLLVGSGTVMLSQYVTDKTAYDISTSINERRLRGGDNFYWGYLWNDKTVERPIEVTRIFALGGEKDADPRARAAPEFTPYFQGEFKRNPISNLFPSFDMVFVVGIVFSLLVFLLTYDCVSGEREGGTLRVLLSCPVPRDTVLAAKWLGGYISVALPVAAAFIAVAIMLLLEPRISVDGDAWLRIAAIAALCLVYIAVVFSAAMVLSTLTRSSSTAVLTLLLFWVLVIVTAPALSTPVAQLLNPPKSPHVTEIDMSRIGITNWSTYLRKVEQLWLERFGRLEWHELTEEQKAKTRTYAADDALDNHQHVVGIVDSMVLVGQWRAREFDQIDRAARWLARLSPYGCLQNAATALAGTGMQQELRLRTAMADYDRAAVRFIDDHLKNGLYEKKPDLNAAPAFIRPRVSLSRALGEAWFDIAFLVLMGLGFSMAAYLAFVRSEVA